MSKHTKPQNRKSHYTNNLQPRKSSRHQKFSEALRISLGLDRSSRNKKRAVVRRPLFASSPLTRRSRRHKAAHRRLLFTLRARRKYRTLPRRGVSRRGVAVLLSRRKLQSLASYTPLRRTRHLLPVIRKWSLRAQLLGRKCARAGGLREKSQLVSDKFVAEYSRLLSSARKGTCRKLVRSRPSAQRAAVRRVFIAQRKIRAARSLRALRRRRRVRPRKRRRYAGKFGKRRRRLERRDKVQIARLLARRQPRAALRRHVRHGLATVSVLRRQLRYTRVAAVAGLFSISTPNVVAFRAGVAAGAVLKQRPHLALLLRAQRFRQHMRVNRRRCPLLNRRALRRKRLKERKKFRDSIVQTRSLDILGAKTRRRHLLRSRKRSRQLLQLGQAKPLPQLYIAPRAAAVPPLRRFFWRKKALFTGRAPKLTRRKFTPPRGRRKRGKMVRRFFNRRQYQRLFVKWRRAVLHRFSSRPAGRRYRGAPRFDQRAAATRSLLAGTPHYATPARLRTTPGAQAFRWLRGRLGYRWGGKNRRRLLTSPVATLSALRVSRRLDGAVVPGPGTRNSSLLVRTAAALETLRRTTGGVGVATPLLVSRRAALAFALRARHQLGQKMYRQQLKLRLPRTTVKRRGLRQGGHTLFAHNTANAPVTWLGARSRLLAPKTSWAFQCSSKQLKTPLLGSDTRYLEHLDDALPRTWKRPPSFMNTLRASRQSEYRKVKTRRQRYLAARRAARRVRLPHNSKVRPLLARLGVMRRALTTSGTPGDCSTSLSLLSRLRVYEEHLAQRVKADAFLGQKRAPVPVTTGAVSRLTLKRVGASSPALRRTAAAAHTQSVRHMLRADRMLSAWSPIYPLKWRRWSSPRLDGRTLPRTWASYKVERQRRMLNESLTFRGLPERRYIDLGYTHLQYYRGSAASVGYARFRRAHRSKSAYYRWWKPVTYPVPFENPYSRRNLNAKKYATKRLSRELLPGSWARGAENRGLKGEYYPVRYPATTIPWRNFRFRSPKRRPAPYTIQRWVGKLDYYATVKSDAHSRSLYVRRSKYAIRRLEKLFPLAAAWAGRRWESLEATTATTADSRLLEETLKRIPLVAWAALRRAAHTAERYATARQEALSRFRRWGRTSLSADLRGEFLSTSVQQLAQNYLLRQLASLTTTLLQERASASYGAISGHTAAHSPGRYEQQVQNKKLRFWTRRQNPRLYKECTGETYNILARENVPLYKRWLRGAERYLRRSQSGYSPTTHDHGILKRTVSLGRKRVRFPASGRRRASYDSMLHAFTKRVSASRFRRVAKVRFPAIQPQIIGEFKFNQTVNEQSRTLRRRRRLARQLGRAAYLAPTWRELLVFRTASPVSIPTTQSSVKVHTASSAEVRVGSAHPHRYGLPFGGGAKRRFASLPTNRLAKQVRAQDVASHLTNTQQTHALRIALLRYALRRRRVERTIFDLRKHALGRRLAKDQLLPPWRARKSARRRSRYAAVGVWSAAAVTGRPATSGFWTLRHLGAVGPRPEDRAKSSSVSSYYGETLRLHAGSLRVSRKNWARTGFGIFPKLKRKLCKRKADSRKRQRRRRRLAATEMTVTRINHWSERRTLRRLHRLTAGEVRHNTARTAARLFLGVRRRRFAATAASKTWAEGIRAKAPHLRLLAWASSQARLRSSLAHARTLTASGLPITSKALFDATSSRRPGKVRRLIRKALRRRSRLGALQSRAYGHVAKPRRDFCGAAGTLATTARYSGIRFVDQPVPFTGATPLFFQNRTKTITKTDATLAHERLANIASKESRYKVTEQYSEGLTSFIPALINQMLSRRVQTEKLTYRKVKRIVSAIYWSLRVYLNVDPFDARFYLRDGNFVLRTNIEQEMLTRAKSRAMEQPQRAALRRRFQPGRLHLAPNSDRFRHDWLRAFFPLKHSLFQEDPDDYGNLPIATSRLRRLVPGGRGIGDWGTAPDTVNLETRSRQILNLRHTRSSPRVETMLQGARRHPEKEQLQAGALRTSITPKNHFFSRHFSSYAHRTTALLGRWIYQQRRFAKFNGQPATAFTAVTGRYRVKARVEARGRAHFAFSPSGTMVGGALDPRFLRYKSPRSRQYLLRLPKAVVGANSDERRANLGGYRAVREKRSAPSAKLWVRTPRRISFCARDTLDAPGPVSKLLLRVRSGVPARRVPSYLTARQGLARGQIAHDAYNTFYTRRKSTRPTWVARLMRTRLRVTQHYRAQGRLTGRQALRQQQTLDRRLGVESARSVLQYRTPELRSGKLEYRAEQVIPATAFELREKAAASAWRWGRFLARDFLAARRQRIERVRVQLKNKFAFTAPRSADGSAATARPYLFRRPAPGRFHRLAWPCVPLPLKFTTSGPRALRFGALARRPQALPRGRVAAGTNFSLLAGDNVSARAGASKAAAMLAAIRRQTPFETYRPRLWHKLTHRWMKRTRLMRTWLKDTKRWLRDPWLSEIVSCRPRARGKRPAGQLPLIEQQIGQYVAEVDERGFDIPESQALFREREEFIPAKTPDAAVIEPIAPGRRALLAAQQRAVSVEARRKPVPTMWLANHEYRGVLKEVGGNLLKTPEQLVEEEQAKVRGYWQRKKAGLPPLKERRLALKHPADHWLPAVIWREIQRRARRLEWRESDELFFRKGFRNAFRFYPGERNRAPWLEALMYNRSLYSTNRGEFRRRQFPREQKKYKWLQRVRKAFFPSRGSRYIRNRRWPRLRTYNQKLFYSLFNLPDRRAASRHFRKLNRRKGKRGGFAHSQTGLGDRLDVTLMHLNLVPTIFWARVVAPHGLLRVNGKIVTDPAHRLAPGDFIQLEQERILRFRHFFKPVLRRHEARRQPNKYSSSAYPTNFTYYPGLRALVFNGLPKESDLRRSNRLNARLFRWFKLDSV